MLEAMRLAAQSVPLMSAASPHGRRRGRIHVECPMRRLSYRPASNRDADWPMQEIFHTFSPPRTYNSTKWQSTCRNELEDAMEHKTLDQIRKVADILPT